MKAIYAADRAMPDTLGSIERAADMFHHPFFRTEWEVSNLTNTLHDRSERALWAIEREEREGV